MICCERVIRLVTEEKLKENIAKNIASLRKERGMTQAELAEALNYSDKSVSKWERGDGIPDILVIHKIAELFGVTLNDIISEEIVVKKKGKKPNLTDRIIIPLLSVGLVFLVFSLVFAIMTIFEFGPTRPWLVFIMAIPVACIPLIVFAALWWEIPQRFVCVTALVWSIVLFLGLAFESEKIMSVIITAGIFQVLVILWFIMRYRSKKRKEKQQKAAEEKQNSGEDK